MKKTPDVQLSIIIPAFNEANYITDCLNSLACQKDAPSFEVIVCDNNSTDATAYLTKNHPLKPILVTEMKRGVTHARQRAFEQTKGHIIVSTDADCTYNELWLRNIYQHFQMNSKIVGLAGNYYFYNGPLWSKIFPYMGSVAVWLVSKIFKRTIYASATNLSFIRSSFSGYDCSLPQGADERGVLRQIQKYGLVKVTLSNGVYTSARRVRKGFLHAIFVTIFYYYTLNVWQTKFSGRSKIGNQPVIREEKQSILVVEFIEWLVFVLVVMLVVILTERHL